MTLNKLYDIVSYYFHFQKTDLEAKVYLWIGGGDGQYTPIFPANDVIEDTIDGEKVVVIKV